MTETPQPVAGSLEARIIRACTVHKMCPVTCPERRVEDLGQIAAFDTRESPIPEKGASPPSWLAWFRTAVKR
jgi:hypothetical protein